MRVRLRLAAGQTVRAEVPDTADLPDLRRAVAAQLGLPAAEELLLGLNRKAGAA